MHQTFTRIARRAVLVLAPILAAVCAQAEARIDWMRTAHADGRHNAFTDLVRWKDAYYLCFRHGETHMSMDGEIRVMTSADMKTWSPIVTLKTFGDDRDPHFVATDDTLYVYFGTWDLKHAEDHGLPDRGSVRSYFASTTDGRSWSKIQGVYEDGFWLWRVRRHDGAFYSAAYTASRPRPSIRETRLLRSTDGLDWELVTTVTKERMAGEADILWRPDGEVWLLSRTGDEAGDAVWFRSDASMLQWTPRDTGVRIHSPVFATWNDRVFVAGREYRAENDNTKIWELIDGEAVEVIALPSRGDAAYPGLIPDPNVPKDSVPAFFVSWYSQHETDPAVNRHAANVYVARVVVE